MESNLEIRLRLLRLIDSTALPTELGDPDDPRKEQEDLRVLRDMIDERWIEGSAFPPGDPFIQRVRVYGILAAGRQAMKDSEPSERRKSFIRNHYRGIASVIGVMVAVLTFAWKLGSPNSPPSPSDKIPPPQARVTPPPSPLPASPTVSPADIPRP